MLLHVYLVSSSASEVVRPSHLRFSLLVLSVLEQSAPTCYVHTFGLFSENSSRLSSPMGRLLRSRSSVKALKMLWLWNDKVITSYCCVNLTFTGLYWKHSNPILQCVTYLLVMSRCIMLLLQMCCEDWWNCIPAIWMDSCSYDSQGLNGFWWQLFAQVMHADATQACLVLNLCCLNGNNIGWNGITYYDWLQKALIWFQFGRVVININVVQGVALKTTKVLECDFSVMTVYFYAGTLLSYTAVISQ